MQLLEFAYSGLFLGDAIQNQAKGSYTLGCTRSSVVPVWGRAWPPWFTVDRIHRTPGTP